MGNKQPIISTGTTNKTSANEPVSLLQQKKDDAKESIYQLSIQSKLSVGSPDDPLEKEADEMADKVMRMPIPDPISFSASKNIVNRKCSVCEKEEELQRKENGSDPVSIAPPVVHDVINSTGGRSIDRDTRSFMESRFNYDFSNVRIHDNDLAAKSAGSIDALAYTSGNNIVFNSGQYNTNSDSGKRLLAHELTHVVQQRPGTKMVRRQVVTQRSGTTVGAGSSNNIREEVLNTLDRLHELWSINNSDYATEYPTVGAFSAGARLPASSIPLTIAAIRLNEQSHIHDIVARNFLGINLTAPVGVGMTNNKNDVSLLQTILRAHRILSETDFISENGLVTASSAATVSDSVIPGTLAALRELKHRIAGGRMGWAPIHADERRYGPTDDRFGARTFEFDQFSIFIPAGAVTTATNKVHVFFSPGDAQSESGSNAVLHHGLRGASDASEWILIGVPGADPGYVAISTGEINNCLRVIGRSTRIDSLRMSAHSRGYRGLRETVRRRRVNLALIDKIIIFDANYGDVASVLRSSGIPASKIVAYDVGTGTLGVAGSTTHHLSPGCMRAIGYSRLINDASITKPALTIPSSITGQLLTLPPRGNFTTQPSPSAPLVNINDFCRINRSAIRAIISNENHPTTGLKTFLDTNDLGRLGSAYPAGIYSHHFFVTELAHEVTD